MCSVFDFIDKQKYFIQSQRKTIKTLYEFLDSIDKPKDQKRGSNGVKKPSLSKPKPNESDEVSNGNYVSDKKVVDKNPSMITANGFLGWIDSGKGEEKRRSLAEERHREYNEFLQQKSRLQSRNSVQSSRRITKLIPDYSDILNDKRIEERKHRQTNGYDIEDIEDVVERHQMKTFPELPTVGLFHCSNNKFDLEHITPRSRLLATHSSRLRAAKYREELNKQVKEKERLRAAERERTRLEEEELEQKLELQRLKLMEEFEAEHKQKAQQNQTPEEVNKQILNRELMVGSTSPISLLRSPTYRHMKESQPLNLSPRKSSAVSRSLTSALSQTLRNSQSMATQTSDEHKHFTSEEESESSISSEEENTEEEEEEEKDTTKEAEFRRRVLSQLSEVRQMMESDHIKMMEQLRQQQLSQLDE